MNESAWPAQLLVERRVDSPVLQDADGAIENGLGATLGDVRWRGERIAVAVGSRGIDQLPRLVSAVVRFVRGRGGAPFILPAMGSHGGATADGQAAVLRALGIEESTIGAPVRSSLDVVDIGHTENGVPVMAAIEAVRSDGIILVNRVKPHTDFAGVIGSGLLKMTAIGLGKAAGAFACHEAAARLGLEAVIRSVAHFQIERLPILAGVAVVEGSRHRLARCEVLPRAELEHREPGLLAEARKWLLGLPLSDLDVLVVDEIGKHISGTGMDTNVIGRGVDGRSFGERPPRIGAIFVRDLSPESHGNAIGLGLADVACSRLVRAMDTRVTFMNALSALTPLTARVPMHFESDRECLDAALRLAHVNLRRMARIVRIRNTLTPDLLMVSEACAAAVAARPDLRVLEGPNPMEFDEAGNLETTSDRWRKQTASDGAP
jgi:hypothetical protein